MARARVELLAHQADLVDDETSKIVVLKGGFRAGKTVGAFAKCLSLCSANYPLPTLLVEPTFPMVNAVFVETARRMAAQWKLHFRWHKSDKIITVGRKRPAVIICRSADNPDSIMGLTVGAGVVDEWEMCGEPAVKAVQSRITDEHAVAVPQLVGVGTAEGFGFGYRWTEEDPKPGLRLLVASTTANEYIDAAAYVERMQGVLTEGEIAEKLHGIRTKKEGMVYSFLVTSGERSNFVPCPNPLRGRIEIWADFNHGKMVWALASIVGDTAHVFGEIIRDNTNTIAHAQVARRVLSDLMSTERGGRVSEDDAARACTVICDAAGDSAHASTPWSSVAVLHQAGFMVRHPRANPAVEDRVTSVQKMLKDRRLLIDKEKAPFVARCFAQQGRTRSGEPEKHKDPQQDMSAGTDAVGYGVWFHWSIFRPVANAVDPRRG